MPNKSEIKLKSLKIWKFSSANDDCLTGIQVNLSNGQKSPAFMSRDSHNTLYGELSIDPQTEIGKYEFAWYGHYIGGIRLFKENGDLIQEWKSNRSDLIWQGIQVVPKGETIVGIHGLSNYPSYFASLGFITKKLQE